MSNRTGEEFKQAHKKSGIRRWSLRSCSICDYPLGFMFNEDGQVFFDPGCGCTDYQYHPEPRTWEDIAEVYNRITDEKRKAELDKLWGFDTDDNN